MTWANTWSKGPLTLAANAYYVSDYKLYGQDLFGVGANNQVQYVCLTTIINGLSAAAAGNCRTASFTYLNLTGSYQISAQWQLFGSVENALDKLPPVNLPSYNGANYNATYSQPGIVGRFFKLGFRFTL